MTSPEPRTMAPSTFKALCGSMGLTAEHFAEHLQVNPRSAQRWSGKVPPPPEAIEYLHQALDAFSDLVKDLSERESIPYFLNESAYLAVTRASMPYTMYTRAVEAAALHMEQHGLTPEVRFISKDGQDITATPNRTHN